MRKHILCALLALGLCAAPLVSCSSGNRLLYSLPDGDRICEIYGGSRPNRIRVSENGAVVWEQKIKVQKNVGDRNGTYGFQITDLNFDGLNDLKITISANGDQLTEVCYLRDAESGTYRKSDALSSLFTVEADAEQQVIFSFEHSYEVEKAVGETPESHISRDITTAYIWRDGELTPYRRVSLTYYSAQDVYCYSVSDYSDILGEFLDPDDKWLTPAEYTGYDFGFLYYFR